MFIPLDPICSLPVYTPVWICINQICIHRMLLGCFFKLYIVILQWHILWVLFCNSLVWLVGLIVGLIVLPTD